MFTDKRYALNLLQRAQQKGCADEAMNLLDGCVYDAELEETDTTIVDWTQARHKLESMLDKADHADREAGAVGGIIVEQQEDGASSE